MKKTVSIITVLAIMILSGACSKKDKISEGKYTDTENGSNIEIIYPVLSSDNKEINSNIYSFVSSLPAKCFPGAFNLNLSYEIKYHTADYISIVYTGIMNVKGSAHPENIFVSDTYDLKTGKRINPGDNIVSPDEFSALVYEAADSQLDEKIKEGFYSVYSSPEDISVCIEKAGDDVFGSWLYLGTDTVGVSLSLPYAAGSYALIEISSDNIAL